MTSKPPNATGPPGPLVSPAFVLAAFDRHEPRLTAYAKRLCHGKIHSAKDAVQHTFMQLCKQHLQKIERNTSAWLYTTCRNRVIDEQRRVGSRRENPSGFNGALAAAPEPIDDHAIDPAEICERQDLIERLRVLIDKLPDEQRDVIDLWCHGFDASDIAGIIDQKPGTVRVKLHRAIKRLQEHPEVSTWLERATSHDDSSVSALRPAPIISVKGE